MPVPTPRLALVALAMALVALLVPLPSAPVALVAADALLLVVAVGDWLRAPRELDVDRTAPAALTLGDSEEIIWRVRNPTSRRLRVRIADELAPSLRPERRRVELRVPPNGRAAAGTRITPARRGRFLPTAMTVRVDGPLGLAARQSTVRVPGELRVRPPFPSREEAELRITRSLLATGLRAARGRGGGTDFDSLREYTVDDEFRRIDWAATARARKPIVRTYRAERNQTVLVLLDSGRTMAGRVGGVPRLEHGMDAAMLLTMLATRLGDRAGLVAFADRVRAVVGPSQRRDQLRRVTDALYALEPELAESDYRGAFTETLSRFSRRALLVLCTELTREATEETLLPALPLVTRDHVVVIAAVRDPDVERWATAIPTETATAYRKAAAVQALADRRRTVARLRGLGATVVDAAPGRLGAELGDAYLQIKATGAL